MLAYILRNDCYEILLLFFTVYSLPNNDFLLILKSVFYFKIKNVIMKKVSTLNDKTIVKSCVLTLLAFGLLVGITNAQTSYTWKGTGKGDWANSKNWTSKPTGGTFPGDNGSVTDTVIISSGSVVLTSGSYSIAQMVMYPSVSASLIIASGAALNIVGGSSAVYVGVQISPSATASDTIVNNGTLSFTGSYSQALSLGGKSGSNQVFTNTGTLQINAACSGPAFNFNSSGVNYAINNSGNININNTGASQAAMSSNNGNAVFTNTGSINLAGTGRVAFGGLTGVFNNSGSFTTDMDFNCKGTFNNLPNGVLSFTGLSTASTYNAMQATVVFNNQGGTISTAPGSKSAIGMGGINTFTAGTISPGGSNGIGVMTISAVAPVTSPLTLNGTLRIQVNGDKVAGTDFDKVSAAKNQALNINGAILDVTGIFTPTKVDTISVIGTSGTTGDSIMGTLSSVIGLTQGWSVYYTSKEVKLVYNPTLPVKLINFKATPLNGINRLLWQTANETNNKGFYIQRQTINGAWNNLCFVTAKGSASNYSFEDNAPMAISYYRLQQVDRDGNDHFSQVVCVNNSKNYKITIAPNPTTDKVHISLPSNSNGANQVATIMVYDFSGKQLLSKQAGSNSLEVDFSTFVKGTYIVKIVADNNIYSEKVVRK